MMPLADVSFVDKDAAKLKDSGWGCTQVSSLCFYA